MIDGVTGTISEYEAKQLLQEHDIPVVEERLVDSVDGAVAAAEAIGFPVMLKVDSRDVQHKTDIGAVMTAHDPEEVEKRYRRVLDAVDEHAPDATVDGVLVEQKLEGQEMIVGVNVDPDFGHVLMFGLGGIFVEILEDVQFRAVPITPYDAERMIADLEAGTILDGVRGAKPADKQAIVDVLLNVSELVEAEPRIQELDINPLFVSHTGAVAADALIRVGDR